MDQVIVDYDLFGIKWIYSIFISRFDGKAKELMDAATIDVVVLQLCTLFYFKFLYFPSSCAISFISYLPLI